MPPLWKEGQENETHFHSPEGPLVPLAMEEKTLGFPASWGSRQSILPHAHETQSVHFPSPGTWSQKGSVGLPRLPLLGERMQSGGPAPITASWYPEIKTRSTCGPTLLEGAEPVRGQKDGRRCGLVGAGVKVQALRWKQGKVLCEEELEARAEWHGQVEKAKRKGLPREATHLAITFRLTEAYTEARGGPFTHPQLHSQRLTASV